MTQETVSDNQELRLTIPPNHQETCFAFFIFFQTIISENKKRTENCSDVSLLNVSDAKSHHEIRYSPFLTLQDHQLEIAARQTVTLAGAEGRGVAALQTYIWGFNGDLVGRLILRHVHRGYNGGIVGSSTQYYSRRRIDMGYT